MMQDQFQQESSPFLQIEEVFDMVFRKMCSVLCAFAVSSLSYAEIIPFYIGTSMNQTSPSQGMYRSTLNTETGQLSEPVLAGKAINPNFLDIHPEGTHLYAVGGAGGQAGTVGAYAIDRATGSLRLLNEQTAGGTNPLHISIDRKAQNVLVANYSSGSVEVLPIQPDGSLNKPSAFIQHEGSSINPQRQAGPHAHCIFASPDNQYVYCSDLGLDKVLIYRFDAARGTLAPADPAYAAATPGSGPRHFTFHPNGRFVYVINEMEGSVTGYTCNASNGSLTPFQTISTFPPEYAGATSSAEIRVTPDGQFLYGSNRGNNSIAAFRIDPAKGTLTLVEFETAALSTPRNINVDPTGNFLLAANQNGNSVSVYRINRETGALDPVGPSSLVGTPTCIRFLWAAAR
jgi:6-phosphogluconolactonase